MLVNVKWKEYSQLMRLEKPIGFFLLWWPVMWALWLASDGSPTIKNIIIFTLGCFFMRSAGCVINDIADRKIDKHVTRTKNRPLTAGRVSTKEALVLFLVLCIASFLLVLFTNSHTVTLSIVGVLLAVLYPFTKRWFMFPQFFLGAAFSWGVVMAFSAEEATMTFELVILYLAVLLLTIVYDTFYAMVDQKDDELIGIKSSAIWFGYRTQKITIMLQTIVLLLMCILGFNRRFSSVYFLMLFLVLLVFFYQQWLITSKETENYFKAFLNNQWVGLIIFIGIVLEF